jgi:hypothetical protein
MGILLTKIIFKKRLDNRRHAIVKANHESKALSPKLFSPRFYLNMLNVIEKNEMVQGPCAHLGFKCWDMGIVA